MANKNLFIKVVVGSLLCSTGSALAQQYPGDFTGEPASGQAQIRPYGCYNVAAFSGVYPFQANGQCPPNTTAGFGGVDNPSTQFLNISTIPASLASAISVTAAGMGQVGSNYISYNISAPLTDFATASSVVTLTNQISQNQTASSVSLAAETSRATTAEGVITANLGAEVSRATTAEAMLASGLAAETNRATAAENNLGQLISNETAAREADIARISWQFRAATASAVALTGNGFIPGKRFNLTINYGAYQGESSLAVQGGYAVNPNAYLNFGIAAGLNGGGSAYRTGVTMGW